MSEPLQFNTPVITSSGDIITLTDLAGSGGGGIRAELLWENPNPNDLFIEQTLEDINMEGFTHLLIIALTTVLVQDEFYYGLIEIKDHLEDYGSNARPYTFYVKTSINAPTLSGTTYKASGLRTIKAGRTEKQIKIGMGMRTDTTTEEKKNVIPVKIYGIDLSSILS